MEKDNSIVQPHHGSIDNMSPEDMKQVSPKDLDETYEVYRRQDARDLDPEEARRVLRKIDLHVMPLLMGTYMLQYLDKSSINFAAVFGLEEGTHLTGQDYSWRVFRSPSIEQCADLC